MTQIKIFPTAQSAEGEDFSKSVVCVIDVLRATTVITTALANGACRVLTVTTPEAALALRQTLGPGHTVLGGERHADRIAGFDLGNSPQDYTPGIVEGKTVALTTTNGTLALRNCASAARLYAACLRNALTTSRAMASVAKDMELDIAIVCSGNYGLFTLEDALCAGLMARQMQEADAGLTFADDFSLGMSLMAAAVPTNSTDAFAQSAHYNRLIAKGYSRDIELCLKRTDTLTTVCCAKALDDGSVEITINDAS